jgi:hypothetical protein
MIDILIKPLLELVIIPIGEMMTGHMREIEIMEMMTEGLIIIEVGTIEIEM